VRDTHLQARIASIEPGSIAEELGLLPGDRVLEINGQAMLDVIDYQQHCASRHVVIKVARGDKLIECEIEKDEEEPIGVVFTNVVFDGVRRCRNRCIFCFVDNLPPGMRSSLYLKDDDYRLSFLHGNFITLSNLTERDWERILRLRLSPLYVSVHATDPDVRARMMGHADPEGQCNCARPRRAVSGRSIACSRSGRPDALRTTGEHPARARTGGRGGPRTSRDSAGSLVGHARDAIHLRSG